MTPTQRTIDAQREPSAPESWRTVSYYSEPYGRAIGFVVIYTPLAVLLLLLSIGVVWWVQAEAMWVAIVFGVLGTVGYMMLVPFHYRFSQEGIDRAHIEAQRDVELHRISTQGAVERAQAKARRQQFAVERMRIEQSRGWVEDRQPQEDMNRLSTWVGRPQADDEMVQEMIRWCERAHSNMTDDGRLTTTAPWTKAGAFNREDSERALKWLALASNAMGHWLVRYDEQRRGWYVNVAHYREASELLTALAAVSPPN